MNFNVFQWRSIKTRVTLLTLAVFVVGIWSLSFYVSRMLQEDMVRLSGEQMASTVSYIAAGVNEELDTRLRLLGEIAGQVSPVITAGTAALQKLLEQRPILPILFNGGTFVTGMDGTATASIPLSAGRRGVNYMDRDFIVAALKGGKATIGLPVMGKQLHSPIFVIAVPIRDTQGNVIGVLAGVTDLGKPNFLDKIAGSAYGKTGGYLLEEPKNRLVITGTDKSRIMQPLPAPGVNPLIDRFVQGFDETGITVNPKGVEVLATARRIPVAGWFIVASLPTREVFAPIRAMLLRILLATTFLTLLAGGLTWWMVKRQLAPMLSTVKTLAALSDASGPQKPLPITRQDEIGELIGGFNRLLESLGQREGALRLQGEIARNMSEGVYLTRLEDGVIVYANPKFEEMFGYDPGEMIGKHVATVNAPGDKTPDRTAREITDVLEKTGEWKGEVENIRKDGTRFWCAANVSMFDHPGHGKVMVAVHTDLTDRKRAEEALWERNELFRIITSGSPDHLLVQGRDLRYSFVMNPQLGLTEQGMLGKTDHDFLSKEDADKLTKAKRIVLDTGEPVSLETSLISLAGEQEFFDGTYVPKYTPQGQVDGLIGYFKNITDRKRAEEEKLSLERQVQQAQKVESLGVLAGGIAHDFNNLLMVVLGHAELVLKEISPMSPARGSLTEITTAARRAADLSRQMLAYSGKGLFVPERVGLGELVQEMAHLFRTSISKKAVLNLDVERGLPPIKADPSQIRQVAMDLIINGSEAIGDRDGVIRVSVGTTRCDEEYLQKMELREALTPGLYVHLEVTDTGVGMDAKTLSRIFEPFFSTKFTGRGLGLAAVQGIVRAHKGALKVYSEPGKGTTFRVLFPALEDAGEGVRTTESPASADRRGKATILLVDDEESLLALGARMLEHLGLTVLTAADGLQAVDLYRERGKEIDLVLMDLTMPHMDGVEAFGELRRLNPGVRVVLASGYGKEDVASRFAGTGPDGVLQKPYTLVTLREALAGLMPARSTGDG